MSKTPAVSVRSIARPLWQALRARPFGGRVLGLFQHACNLADDEGRLVVLAGPALGNGPFSIILEAAPTLFAALRPGQVVAIDAAQIQAGAWRIALGDAPRWEPALPDPGRALCLAPPIAATLRPYAEWPPPAGAGEADRRTGQLLAQGAHALLAAAQRGAGMAAAAQQLAGLGAGLTPAGDDYMLGAMAALWLLDERAELPAMARAAAAHTTLLSSALLLAAAQGQFMEAWHDLAHALRQQDEGGCRESLQRIAAFGASSGRASLAGFAAMLLSARAAPRADPARGRAAGR